MNFISHLPLHSHRFAISSLHPHPAGSSIIVMPASQICMTNFSYCLDFFHCRSTIQSTSECPFNRGFTLLDQLQINHTRPNTRKLTSCGISPAIKTQLVSAAVNTVSLLKMCPYVRRAINPNSQYHNNPSVS